MSVINLRYLLDNGHSDIIDLMLQKKIIDNEELATVDESNRKLVVRVFIKQKIFKNPTWEFIVNGEYDDVIKLLLQRRLITMLEETFAYDKTLLLIAAGRKQHDIVELLVTQGANINALSMSGYSALYFAVGNNDMKLLEFLLSNGANPNLDKHYSTTPLLYAVNKIYAEMVQLLLNHGADIDAQDGDSNTSLIIAALSKSDVICKILIDAGAKLDIKDSFGKTALDYAKEKCCPGIIAMIEEAMNKLDKVNKNVLLEQICKDCHGEVYPILTSNNLICVAVYRINPNENVPTTQLVAITDDETMVQVWVNNGWSDKKISTKGMFIQLPNDAVHKIDYHVVMIDGWIKSYAKFDSKMKIASGVLGDCYRG